MSAYSNLVIADGAVGYWRLGETSGTTAVDSVGGKNGTISGGVTLNQPGPLAEGSKAMVFDGASGGIQIGGVPDLLSTITLEAWINPTAGAVSCLYFASTQPMRLRHFGAGSVHQFDVTIAGTTRSLQAGLVVANVWTHVVGTFDGTFMRLYVNGALLATSPSYPGAISAGQSPWWIGRYGSGLYFAGGVAEVALYPTALTAAQAAAHYITGTAAATPSAWVPLAVAGVLR